MLNQTIIMGRLTDTPELRRTQNNIPVTSFTLAVERNYKNKSGEKDTDFLDFVAWKTTAEFTCNYFQKGQLIAVSGHIETRNYVDKNGNKRKAFDIIADSVYFAEPKRDRMLDAMPDKPSFSEPQNDYEEIPSIGDDLPF